MIRTASIGALLTIMSVSLSAKDGSTYYTPERIRNGRSNLDKYEWGKKEFGRIVAGDTLRYYIGPRYGPADKLIEKSDEFIWMLQPTTKIPRFVPRNVRARCPVHGIKVRDKNPWCPYRIDPINRPYKIQCMLGGEWYPSNDFAAGDMTSGDFPDDGNGINHGGDTFHLLSEYAHMVYGSFVVPSLRSLSMAYVLTGKKAYARKGTILLARLASEYPNYKDRIDRVFYAKQKDMRDPDHSWKRGGMITDLIWETFMLEATVLAYDALYPYMDEDDEMLAFLKSHGMPIKGAGELRRYIEDRLVRPGMQGLLDGHIHGNEGHHQAAAMACALVLDDFDGPSPNSKDMVDYTYHGIGHSRYLLINGLTRDGGGHESPNYNRIKLDLIRVNRLMELIRERQPKLFPESDYPDLFAGKKAERMFDFFIGVTIQGYSLPSIGDCGGIRAWPERLPERYYSFQAEDSLFAFQKYGAPRFARACTRPDGSLFNGDLFEPYPEDELKAALQKPRSQILKRSRLLDGYGLGILASGEGAHRRTVMLNYTSLIGHRQMDNLNLEFVARGVDLLPDLGYPKTWKYRGQWDSNSMAHNTVTVDETQPTRGIGGTARLFASEGGVHVITASHDPYPPGEARLGRPDSDPCDLYERTVVLVDIDKEHSYVVDAFAVNGGEQHDQSWHGVLVKPEAPSLDWEQQENGTLAGKGVPQFDKWKDKWGRDRDDFPTFLTEVRRAAIDEPVSWTWHTGLNEGDALRLHLIPFGSEIELIHGRGRSPARPEDWWLDYILARRHLDGGPSLFLSVLDAFQKEPTVESARLISTEPVVLEVKRTGGTDRIQLHIPLTESRSTEHRALGLRVQSVENDEQVCDVQIGTYAPDAGPGYIQTTIQSVDYERDEIVLPVDENADAFFSGAAIRIYNQGRSAMFRIKESESENGFLRATLDATALLAQGKVIEARDGRLKLDSYLVFANGKEDRDGNLLPGRYHYAGSYVGDAEKSHQVRGVLRGEKSLVYLKEEVPLEELKATWEGKVVSIWQYAVGDKVEVARVLQR